MGARPHRAAGWIASLGAAVLLLTGALVPPASSSDPTDPTDPVAVSEPDTAAQPWTEEEGLLVSTGDTEISLATVTRPGDRRQIDVGVGPYRAALRNWSPDGRYLVLDAGGPERERQVVLDPVSLETHPVPLRDRYGQGIVWEDPDHLLIVRVVDGVVTVDRHEVGSASAPEPVSRTGVEVDASVVTLSRAGLLATAHGAAGAAPSVRIVDTRPGPGPEAAYDLAARTLSWSPDGDLLVVDNAEGTYLVDPTAEEPRRLDLPGELDTVFWSPSGRWLVAFGSEPGSARVVDVSTAQDWAWPELPVSPSLSMVSWQPVPACTVAGTGGDDVLRGTAGDDVVCAGAGDDVVLAGPGHDTVRGGPGRDRLSFATSGRRAGVRLREFAAEADGTTHVFEIEEVLGSVHDDVLVGSPGDELLAGGAGDDALDGAAGDDRLRGGEGEDTAAYGVVLPGRYTVRRIEVDLAAGSSRGADGEDELDHVENLTSFAQLGRLAGDGEDNVLASDGRSTLVPRGGDDVVAGHGAVSWAGAPRAVRVDVPRGVATGWGTDLLASFPERDDPPSVLHMTRFDDEVVVTTQAVVLGAGDDAVVRLRGGEVAGGPGRDRVDLSPLGRGALVYAHPFQLQRSRLYSEFVLGREEVVVDDVEAVLMSPHDDVLLGGPRLVRGGAGDDFLLGTGWAERLGGGPGADVVVGKRGIDRIDGGSGTDDCRADRRDTVVRCP